MDGVRRLAWCLVLSAGCSVSHESHSLSDASSAADGSAWKCASGIEWIDAEPLRMEMASGASPSIASDGAHFFVVTTAYVENALHDAGYWTLVSTFSSEGPTHHQIASFAPYVPIDETVPRVFALSDPYGHAVVAAIADDALWWSSGPDFDIADGAMGLDGAVEVVALERDAFLIETHHDAPIEGRGIASRIERRRFDGRAPVSLPELDSTFGRDYRAPSLASTIEGPWFMALSNAEPASTLRAIGPRATVGTSCSAESYDTIAISGDTIVIVSDCDERVVVERYASGVLDGTRARFASGRHAAGSHLAYDGSNFAVAYQSDFGFAHVALLDESLALTAADIVPETNAAEWPTDSLDIAALRDGTFAVMTTSHGALSVRRFRACD